MISCSLMWLRSTPQYPWLTALGSGCEVHYSPPQQHGTSIQAPRQGTVIFLEPTLGFNISLENVCSRRELSFEFAGMVASRGSKC